eukprot:TRINITY_DN3358_c0_g1_i1.p1 TRINITY_DN3358_c0_g1~~TRINITY_DN3358_c0_g1_i1.p1  ORF type:complete len:336 (-),score=24.54 TRINITY_DN3358_c0_g1_i1:88-990(-)
MAHDHEEHIRQQVEWEQKHGSHEGLHQFLFVLLIVVIILSQLGLHYWKRNYYRSFQQTTLFGLWIIPFVFCIAMGWWRMILVWSLFTSFTGYLLWKASQSTLEKDMPRKIYAWFFFLWRVSYGIALFGYVLVMVELFGASRILAAAAWDGAVDWIMYTGVMCLSYGLYFGVLGRDCAEMCTDRVASKIGYTGKNLPAKAIPERSCGICGEEFETRFAEVELNCKHRFHEWCIRGWTMIGKKDTCPYCSEKVQLNHLFKNPWEKQGILFANLLDSLRYLIVWNPIILTAVNFLLYSIDPGA